VLQLEIQGLPELTSGLSRVGSDLEKTAPAQALQLMLNAAQDRAPVRTGALRASGYVQGQVVGFSANHAFPVHWGTRRMARRPFLRDGIEQTESQWIKIYEEDVQKQLDTIKGA
jgi:HK97 gp10 family phage protein